MNTRNTFPRQHALKRARIPGATISYSPSAANERFVEDLREAVKQRISERQKKARIAAQAPRPDLTPRPFLVAYIDILGFGRELERAKTKAELQRAYGKVRFVQREFQMESAAQDADEQRALNRIYGRRVIALSDAIVVAVTPNAPGRFALDRYDLLGFAVYELILAQTRCVARGIFLRGGVSHGSFFFEDDVLLSPALVRAYEIETQHADYPLIVVPKSTRDAVCRIPGQWTPYAKGADPTPHYFKRHGGHRWRGESLYYLDYAGLMLNEEHRGLYGREREKYIQTKRKSDFAKAQAALNRSGLKDAAYFLRAHRKAIERAFRGTSSAAVRRKYRWLTRYHNRCFWHDTNYCRREVIDLSKF